VALESGLGEPRWGSHLRGSARCGFHDVIA
jgi:hypothetical protein